MKPIRLVVLAKYPEAHKAKTRLIKRLGADGAAKIATQLFSHTIEQVSALSHVQVELCVTPYPDRRWQTLCNDNGVQWSAQADGDLGHRMATITQRAMALGESIILMGTDCPALSAEKLQEVIDALPNYDAVMIPATDGGYVLLALNQYHPSIFEDLPWSTSAIAHLTLERLRARDYSVHCLEALHDIDTPDDLQHLPRHWNVEGIQHIDLSLEKNILVFGGVYGNLQALKALLSTAKNMGIAHHQMICTGDVLAYCAQPNECIELIRDSGIHLIAGNCEIAIAQAQSDCGCGFAQGTSCQILSDDWFAFNRRVVTQKNISYLQSLPEKSSVSFGNKRWLAIHGGVEKNNEFIFASNAGVALKNAFLNHFDGVLAGHSGLPFTHVSDEKVWHNSGALGMPANDGTSRIWFSTLTFKDEQIKITHHALNYDHQKTQHFMRKSDLNTPYCESLASGIWPSQDILPVVEKNQMGIAIECKTHNLSILERTFL